jgi:hypothetical protein
MGRLEPDQGAVPGGGGEFGCAAVYPSPQASLRLGRQNLHLFRFKNTRFDVIGGAFYFLMVVRALSLTCRGSLSYQGCHNRMILNREHRVRGVVLLICPSPCGVVLEGAGSSVAGEQHSAHQGVNLLL